MITKINIEIPRLTELLQACKHEQAWLAQFDDIYPWLADPFEGSEIQKYINEIARNIKSFSRLRVEDGTQDQENTQSLSYSIQVSAEVRFIPSPPALVLRRNTLYWLFSSLNSSICST
jgi:hypothetical protein